MFIATSGRVIPEYAGTVPPLPGGHRGTDAPGVRAGWCLKCRLSTFDIRRSLACDSADKLQPVTV
jgi:hypothetical protein